MTYFKTMIAATALVLGAGILSTGILSTGANAATLIQNGSFENGIDAGTFTTINAGQSGIDGWTVDDGSVDYIGSYWQAADGNRSVDLSGNGPGVLSQKFATTVGQRYNLTFSLSGNPDSQPNDILKRVQVSVESGFDKGDVYTFDASANSKSDMGWLTITYSFIAQDSLSKLVFASLNDTPYGPALDNVSVSAVPLPAALPLFATGLAGLGFFGRRRKAA